MTSVEEQASPPTTVPWVPLWPLSPQAQQAEWGTFRVAANTALAAAPAITTAPLTKKQGSSGLSVSGGTDILVAVGGTYELDVAVSIQGLTDWAIISVYHLRGGATVDSVDFVAGNNQSTSPFFGGASSVAFGGVQAGDKFNVTITPATAATLDSRSNVTVVQVPVAVAISPVNPTYGTSLPASPADGQEAILVDSILNPTYQWRFRYNASSSSPYKWEFVGGSDKSHVIDTSEAIGTANAWANLATDGPLFTAPRAGEYRASYSLFCSSSDGSAAIMYGGICLGDTGALSYSGGQIWLGGVGAVGEVKQTLAAGETLKVRYFAVNTVGKTFANRNLHIRPVRVA